MTTPTPFPSDPPRQWPRCAVSVAIFRHGKILLAERGKPPLAGVWSLPGGHVEPGETTRSAALRELLEETGITAELSGHLDVHDVISRTTNGELRAHYVLNIFYGIWRTGEPIAASDCRTARFVTLGELATYNLTNGAEDYIRRAHQLL
ncbi:MAG TPA: NUDIX hydrolase [Hyphomicrobiaceae bacterium]|nr:NUDIX hydrolase [Hyphomicrobiaceae bacterium]